MNSALTKLSTLLVPVVTIAGLVVLMALKIIDAGAGLGLIGVLSGAHATATITASASAQASQQAALQQAAAQQALATAKA